MFSGVGSPHHAHHASNVSQLDPLRDWDQNDLNKAEREKEISGISLIEPYRDVLDQLGQFGHMDFAGHGPLSCNVHDRNVDHRSYHPYSREFWLCHQNEDLDPRILSLKCALSPTWTLQDGIPSTMTNELDRWEQLHGWSPVVQPFLF